VNQQRIIITASGEIELRAELKHLKSKARPQVIAAIAEARAHGDLSENAEYHAAREQQSFMEGRIAELEFSLAQAEVIDPKKMGVVGKIVFGAMVTLYDVNNETEVSYQLVGDLEANLELGRISISSPVGRALIGKRQDDEVIVKTPSGKRAYEVISISY
jgi:transcription elongation factor GreA